MGFLDLLEKNRSRLINCHLGQMKSSDPWIPIARPDEIKKGKLLLWEEDGYSLLLTRIADQLLCFENVCPHLGWPLDMSAVQEGLLICTHHRFKFDILSGTCPLASELSLRYFPVRLRNQLVEVRLDRTTEGEFGWPVSNQFIKNPRKYRKNWATNPLSGPCPRSRVSTNRLLSRQKVELDWKRLQ